jgi:hypothetical protein
MSSEDKRFLFGGFNLNDAIQQVLKFVKNVCANAPPGMKEIYKLLHGRHFLCVFMNY